MARIPEVRIYFSWQLYRNVSLPLQKLNGVGIETGSERDMYTYAANYRDTWAKYADRILPALTTALGVEFYSDVIDVPCTPGIIPLSDPMALNFYYDLDQFVDILTHELCHLLLTDNTVYSIHSSEKRVRLNDRWKRLFGDEHTEDTLAHIPVDALLKHVFLDVLKEPTRLPRDIKNLERLPDYKAAWEYVETHDYKEIIKQLHDDYEAIKRELEAE